MRRFSLSSSKLTLHDHRRFLWRNSNEETAILWSAISRALSRAVSAMVIAPL
jgi:hypothetical protein